MRYVELVMYPSRDVLHPVERRLADEPDLTRKAMHAFEALADGTVAVLTEVEGDLDRYREIVESSPEVHEFAVSGEETGFCYSRVDATAYVAEMLEQRRSAPFVVQLPIEYTADGGRRLTLVGREEDFVGSPVDVPDGVRMELVSTGPYQPEAGHVFSDLTARQREVLETALQCGYYENPRETTHEAIADEVGIEPGTVGKHLRNVESAVFSRYVR